ESLAVFNPLREGSRVYLTLPDGRRVGFTFTPVKSVLSGVTTYEPAFTADAGVDYQLDSAAAVLTRGRDGFYELATARPYNPASGEFEGPQYTLTGPDGSVYRMSVARGVEELRRADGARFYFSDGGITGADGDAVSFVRDEAGRLSAMIASDGQKVVYEYDSAGRVVAAHRTASGETRRYGYEASGDGRLTLATGPSSGAGSVIEYDFAGGVTSSPLTRDLGGTHDFLAGPYAGRLSAGSAARFAINLLPAEVARTPEGFCYIGVEISTDGGFDPAAPSIAGGTTLRSWTAPGKAFALIAVPSAGLQLLEFAATDASASGDYALRAFLAGDANEDGNIDGLDGASIAQLLGARRGDANFSPAADANRDDVVD
ncbi:MAG TPA: hypothetical protein PLV92_28325, partial [Pirellulaceae bacterium]|nr:hypothetical protein [Pirellulaceae bacterium]